jgi:hypothetical protein
MSAELNKKIDKRNHYSVMETTDTKKVNLNDLVKRMQAEERKQKKNNVILSAAAISAVAVFGIILTL